MKVNDVWGQIHSKTVVTTRELKMSGTGTTNTTHCRMFTENTWRSVKRTRMFFFCYRQKTQQCVLPKTHRCVLCHVFFVNTETPRDVFFLLQSCVLKVSHMKHLIFTVYTVWIRHTGLLVIMEAYPPSQFRWNWPPVTFLEIAISRPSQNNHLKGKVTRNNCLTAV